MKHDTLLRSHLVLSGIRQQQNATRTSLQCQLAMDEAELRRALRCLNQYQFIESQGWGVDCRYRLTAQGEAWWHEHRPPHALGAEKVNLLEKRRARALELEAHAFWHRAARQWLFVLDLCDDAQESLPTAHAACDWQQQSRVNPREISRCRAQGLGTLITLSVVRISSIFLGCSPCWNG